MLLRAGALALLCTALVLTQVPANGQSAADDSTVTRLVPPPDGSTHFGFTYRLWDTSDPQYGDSRPFEERIRDAIELELASKTPAFLTVWAAWERPGERLIPFREALPDIEKVKGVTAQPGVVYLDWTITSTTATNGGITTKDIASGSLDHYIRTYAQAVREYGQPLLIRLFNGEFNGDWWYGVSPRANPNLTTRDFVKAWRRVVDIFRAVGTRNATWAWVVNGYPADPSQQPQIDRNIAAYYPGDDYVDWAGGDAYDVGSPDWLDAPYAFSVAHGKPFFVAEWAVRHEWSELRPAQQRDWLEAMFDYFETHLAVKAIAYFNYNNRPGGTRVGWDPKKAVYLYDGQVSYLPNVNDHDHRLLADSGTGWRALFSRRISSPRYVSGASSETVQVDRMAATAAVNTVVVNGRSATVRWSGNLAADRFDVAIKRSGAAWKTLASRTLKTSLQLHGISGERVRLRVRPYTVDGVAAPWTPSRTITFPSR